MNELPLNKIIQGDCLEVLKTLPENSVDSICCDPPYELGFMGKSWDNTGIANNKEMWAECLRVLKPGGHLLAFSGTRTYHRMACAIEDAGFEVRDMIEWIYASGFPKSLNVWKQLKKNCTCGNMEAYERATQKPEHNLRPMPETDLPQEVHFDTEQGEVLFTGLSEQSTHGSMQGEEPKKGSKGRKKRVLEGRDNLQETEGKLQGSDLPEMPERVSFNGEERRLHNATQVGDGSTPEPTTDEGGSSASHRPQSEQQQDREPCAFCKQWGTQATRTFGIGTALKPAHEPICMARKPLAEKTVAENCLKYGTGGINIDESRVEAQGKDLDKLNSEWDREWNTNYSDYADKVGGSAGFNMDKSKKENAGLTGRFPANLIHDNSDEVRECFPETKSGWRNKDVTKNLDAIVPFGAKIGYTGNHYEDDNEGNASRFFKSIENDPLQEWAENEVAEHRDEILEDIKKEYGIIKGKSIIYQAKASKSERNKGCEELEEKETKRYGDFEGTYEHAPKLNVKNKNNHPTVKPIALMEYLIKMVTPKFVFVCERCYNGKYEKQKTNSETSPMQKLRGEIQTEGQLSQGGILHQEMCVPGGKNRQGEELPILQKDIHSKKDGQESTEILQPILCSTGYGNEKEGENSKNTERLFGDIQAREQNGEQTGNGNATQNCNGGENGEGFTTNRGGASYKSQKRRQQGRELNDNDSTGTQQNTEVKKESSVSSLSENRRCPNCGESMVKRAGVVLDPFAGSGSTLVAAKQNGYQYIGIELTYEYIPIIEARLDSLDRQPDLFDN